MTANILEISNLSWKADSGAGGLRDVSFRVPKGAFVLVAGPSGGGKTTLLRLLVGLEEPAGGEIRFDGRSAADIPPTRLRRQMALLPQTPTVVEGSVRENLLLPFSFQANSDLAPPDDAALTAMLGEFLLAGVGLADRAQPLSVGQRQRLCLIRSLMLQPQVLLLDEPVSALDAASKEAVEDAAERLCLERGMTVILVSHAGFAPRRVSPRRLVVENNTVREAS
jgi:putative ABC transport system ATP-binding protein